MSCAAKYTLLHLKENGKFDFFVEVNVSVDQSVIYMNHILSSLSCWILGLKVLRVRGQMVTWTTSKTFTE